MTRWFSSYRSNEWLLPLWKVFFASAAIADLSICWPSFVAAWQGHESFTCAINDNTCSEQFIDQSMFRIQGWIGPFFCVLCLGEAIIRAKEARTLALEMNALDSFEKSLRRVYSTTRTSLRLVPDTSVDEVLARSTLRTWIPVLSVVCFWLSLLPYSFYHYECGYDAAFTSFWITYSQRKFLYATEVLHSVAMTQFWKWALPFKLYQLKFYGRIRLLLRWIRYIRFAGPLARMAFKLWDQLVALSKTWRQALSVQAEKAKRVAHRSMLLEDLRRVESLAKVQTALAALPSQLFQYASGEINDIRHTLAEQQSVGRDIQSRLRRLRADIARNISTAELYDRVVHLTQDLTTQLNRSALSSSQYLISPHTRFSVSWRVTVTNCLLLEIFRLCVSWRLTNTFQLTLTNIIRKLLIECQEPAVSNRFAFVTRHVTAWHRHVSNLVPLIPPPIIDLTYCEISSPSTQVFLLIGHMLEMFVDAVNFMDIFIWFFTGDLDARGVLVPKPFFTRCILPGTLVQVLDHPTIPDALPALLSQAMYAIQAVGWSRCIRWTLAIGPAVVMLVFNPLNAYFFRHMGSDEELMRYAESCGMLAPTIASSSSLTNRSDRLLLGSSSIASLALGSRSMLASTRPSTGHLHTDSSQVGMFLDSPVLSGRPVRNMVHMSNSDHLLLASPALKPALRQNQLSVQFEDSINEDLEDDYKLSYSLRSLQGLKED